MRWGPRVVHRRLRVHRLMMVFVRHRRMMLAAAAVGRFGRDLRGGGGGAPPGSPCGCVLKRGWRRQRRLLRASPGWSERRVGYPGVG